MPTSFEIVHRLNIHYQTVIDSITTKPTIAVVCVSMYVCVGECIYVKWANVY